MTTETLEQTQTGLGILETPEIKLPPRPPEVHQGTLVSVSLEQFQSGSRGVKFLLDSDNVQGFQRDLMVFIPEVAYENLYITSDEIGKLPAPEGKKMTPKEQWGRAKETIESVLRIALKQGREIPTDKARPSTFEEYVALVDEVTAGINIVFRLAVDKNPAEPQFANSLKVRQIYDADAATNPKLFKGAIKRWETQEEAA